VTHEGVQSKEELTVRSWQRAGALARFLAPHDNHFVHPELERPTILFACKPGPAAPSLRLAELIQTEFNCACFEGEEEVLVQKALLAKGTVLIAWKHRNMRVIANAQPRPNLLWVFGRRGGSWTFTQVPRLLLADDRPDVIV
jgi:hypothetical protein